MQQVLNPKCPSFHSIIPGCCTHQGKMWKGGGKWSLGCPYNPLFISEIPFPLLINIQYTLRKKDTNNVRTPSPPDTHTHTTQNLSISYLTFQVSGNKMSLCVWLQILNFHWNYELLNDIFFPWFHHCHLCLIFRDNHFKLKIILSETSGVHAM